MEFIKGKWYKLPKCSNYIVKYLSLNKCSEFITANNIYHHSGGACTTDGGKLMLESEIKHLLPKDYKFEQEMNYYFY